MLANVWQHANLNNGKGRFEGRKFQLLVTITEQRVWKYR